MHYIQSNLFYSFNVNFLSQDKKDKLFFYQTQIINKKDLDEDDKIELAKILVCAGIFQGMGAMNPDTVNYAILFRTANQFIHYTTEVYSPQIEKVKALKLPLKTSQENIPPSATLKPPTPEKAEVTKIAKRLIQEFVDLYLHPYLTGQITAENEDKWRDSLPNILTALFKDDAIALSKLQHRKDLHRFLEPGNRDLSLIRKAYAEKMLTDDQVVSIALNVYLKQSVRGLYVHYFSLPKVQHALQQAKWEKRSFTRDVELKPQTASLEFRPYEPNFPMTCFEVVIRALKSSMAMDFPNISTETDDFQQLLILCWKRVNVKRQQSHIEAVKNPEPKFLGNPLPQLETAGLKVIPVAYRQVVAPLLYALIKFSSNNETIEEDNKEHYKEKINTLKATIEVFFQNLAQRAFGPRKQSLINDYKQELLGRLNWEMLFLEGTLNNVTTQGRIIKSRRHLASFVIPLETRKIANLLLLPDMPQIIGDHPPADFA